MYTIATFFILLTTTVALIVAAPSRTASQESTAYVERSTPGTAIIERNVRCGFPGVVYNWSNMPVTIRYDNGAQLTETIPAGGNSTQFICDADFLKVDGGNLQVWDHNIGPYKNRGIVQSASGSEFKLDAYTLRCLSVGSSATVLCFGSYNGNQY